LLMLLCILSYLVGLGNKDINTIRQYQVDMTLEAFELIKQLPEPAVSVVNYYQGATLSYAYAVSGDKAIAKAELMKTLAKYPDQSPYNIARAYLSINDYNNALNNLEKAYEQKDIWMYILKVDPTFDPIRNEPRFKELIKRMRLE
jgi:tetratricopeptide (TPR) repeat protein